MQEGPELEGTAGLRIQLVEQRIDVVVNHIPRVGVIVILRPRHPPAQCRAPEIPRPRRPGHLVPNRRGRIHLDDRVVERQQPTREKHARHIPHLRIVRRITGHINAHPLEGGREFVVLRGKIGLILHILPQRHAVLQIGPVRPGIEIGRIGSRTQECGRLRQRIPRPALELQRGHTGLVMVMQFRRQQGPAVHRRIIHQPHQGIAVQVVLPEPQVGRRGVQPDPRRRPFRHDLTIDKQPRLLPVIRAGKMMP